MIRITKQADYGILLMSLLARGADGRIHTAKDLARETRLGLPMVAKILKLLVRSGLLVSHRGVRGGYTLRRAPSAISIAEIISTLDGPFALTECTSERSGCAVESTCPVRAPWHRINEVILEALERVTLAEMTCPIADPVGAFVSDLGSKKAEVV